MGPCVAGWTLAEGQRKLPRGIGAVSDRERAERRFDLAGVRAGLASQVDGNLQRAGLLALRGALIVSGRVARTAGSPCDAGGEQQSTDQRAHESDAVPHSYVLRKKDEESLSAFLNGL
jgi:hypothetical protein